MKYFIDAEFDGHNGPLLSLAIVTETGPSLHIRTTHRATDAWVVENVEPLMGDHNADVFGQVAPLQVGFTIREFMGDDPEPVVIADSPVDIARFCRAISTGPDGGWASADYPLMTFEVHNVDCYPTSLPGAVRHNAWWDAMALREKLTAHQ